MKRFNNIMFSSGTLWSLRMLTAFITVLPVPVEIKYI